MKYIFLLVLFVPFILFAQVEADPYNENLNDSLQKIFEENALKIDTLGLKVSSIIITGNKTTKDDIILREMHLKKGSKFTLKEYSEDLLNIYNLALFTKVDIIPVPMGEKEIALNVDVQERWYILPLPNAGIEEGEWKKVWLSMNLRWDNFRGRNERLNAGFRVFYNPSVSLSYFVPWIGEKLHLFMGIGGAWQRQRNRSLTAVGRESGSNTIAYNDSNYENVQYKAELTLGRYFGKNFSVFTEYKFNHLRVSQYAPGRTVSDDGVDRYITLGAGVSWDSRDINEYATKGLMFRTMYERYGFLDEEVNFGRFILENQSFIPVPITKNYYITIASKLYTSLAMGAVIPVYNHEYLGYSEDYVRGWKGKAYEGDDIFTVYNEIRIPVIKPRYVRGKDMMIVKDIPIVKNLDIRHGLYFTLIYDIGTVWYKDEKISSKRFYSGAGIGINVIAPFGYVLRADWVFRLGKPTVGQIGFSLSAKF
ncbi:MAG: BamA/TamA family outer membrane protein [Ignavibacteria bacterium]|nr:BamA/TamA family outer membrane protein [Ignavibacteria bacterium]